MRTNTKAPPRAQATKRSIPSPTAPNALSVSDGTITAGTVVEYGKAHFAFGPDQKLVGKFPTRAAAIAALPPVQS